MENDQIIEAEVDAEAVRRATARRSRDLDGKDMMLVTEGGFTSGNDRQDASEQTPLIDRRDGEDEGPDEPFWSGDVDFQGLPWWKKPSVFWLLPLFAAYALAFGGIIVPKLNLILTLICREYMSERAATDPTFFWAPVILGEDNEQCRIPAVQARVSQFTLYGSLISGLLAAIVSPKLGALSDRYGRKPVLMYCSAGMFVTEIVTICAANYPDTFPVAWLLIGYLFEGLCGSYIASAAISNSYATDCTPPQRRAVVFAWFHGCLFTGIALGPILAGYVIKATGHVVTVFYIALGVHVVFIIFLAILVPESVSKRRQKAARERYNAELEALGPAADWINQLRGFNFFAPLKILYPTGPGSNRNVRRNLILLATVDTTMFGVAMGAMTVVIIYTNYKFGWGNFESSRFVTIVNSCRVSCLLILLPLITRFFGGSERNSRRRAAAVGATAAAAAPTASNPTGAATGADLFDLNIIRLAVFMDMLGFIGYATASTGALFTLSGAIASAGGIGSPTLQSALTKHVPQERVGQLLGAMGLLHALARVGGPLVFNGIYSATVGQFDQTVFVCLAAAFGFAFVCAWLARPGVHLDDMDDDEVPGQVGNLQRSSDEEEDPAQRGVGRRASMAVTQFYTTVSTSVALGLIAAWNFTVGGGGG